jgi:hypothetical protein
MADDVHVHQTPSGGGGMGWVAALVAVVVLLLVVWFLFAGGNTEPDTDIEVPDQIEVDINAPGQG